METTKLILSTFAVVALASTATVSAQTIWTGAAAGDNVNTPGNWDNGLPTSVGNPGTIPASAGALFAVFNYNDYFVIQTGGTLTSNRTLTLSGGSSTLNSSGSITSDQPLGLQGANDGHQDFFMNGGTLSRSGLSVSSAGTNRSATFNMSGGDLDLSGGLTGNNGGMIIISGGTVDIAGGIRLNSLGANLIISGGTVNVGGNFGREGTILLTGGNITAGGHFSTTMSGTSLTLGGTSAASFTVDATGSDQP